MVWKVTWISYNISEQVFIKIYEKILGQLGDAYMTHKKYPVKIFAYFLFSVSYNIL